MIDALSIRPRPAEDAEAIDAAVAAMQVVRDDFEAARVAAAAGDRALYDEIEARTQGTDLPAMEAAMDAGPDEDCPGTSD